MDPIPALPAGLRRLRDRIRSVGSETRTRLAASPIAITAVLATLFLSYAAYRLFEPMPAGTWPELKDSVIFEYIGWYLAQGNRLYIDVWEVKPPLAFEVTAVLAFLAGDNVERYHVLNLLANSGAIIIGASAAAGIVQELTDDPLGAVVAGVATFTIPFYFYRALIGFKAKYFVVAAGLGCLYLAYRDRPLAAGVAGAAAVGFWQLAIIFPIGALGMCWQRVGGVGVKRFVVGGGTAAGIILLPVVLWGAVPAMVAEVLLTPLLTSSGHTFSDRLQFIVRTIGMALPIALLGMAGFAEGIVTGRVRDEWPMVLALVWFSLQMIALDFDARPDVFPWMAVVVVGSGLAVANLKRVHRGGDDPDPSGMLTGARLSSYAVGAMILGLVVLSVVTMGGYGSGSTGLTDPDTYNTSTELDPDYQGARTYNATELQYVYWNRVPIPTCRAFGAVNQMRLVNLMGLAEDRPWYMAQCGKFDPVWNATRAKYGV